MFPLQYLCVSMTIEHMESTSLLSQLIVKRYVDASFLIEIQFPRVSPCARMEKIQNVTHILKSLMNIRLL